MSADEPVVFIQPAAFASVDEGSVLPEPSFPFS
jgi:hypothetical protein